MDRLERSTMSASEFSTPFLDLVPASGAAVSTIGAFLGSETLSASTPLAATLDELQFDLGEGPCWDAMRSGRPALHEDVRAETRSPWPAFADAIRHRNVCSIFAFPLKVGSLRFGAVDLYSLQPLTLTPDQLRSTRRLADAVGRRVLQNALTDLAQVDEPGNLAPFPRRVIHQATGMVMAQLDISSADAGLVIQGQAFATSRPMMEVAQAIIDRTLSFSNGEGGIEETS